jgi:hypothetical protein
MEEEIEVQIIRHIFPNYCASEIRDVQKVTDTSLTSCGNNGQIDVQVTCHRNCNRCSTDEWRLIYISTILLHVHVCSAKDCVGLDANFVNMVYFTVFVRSALLGYLCLTSLLISVMSSLIS